MFSIRHKKNKETRYMTESEIRKHIKEYIDKLYNKNYDAIKEAAIIIDTKDCHLNLYGYRVFTICSDYELQSYYYLDTTAMKEREEAWIYTHGRQLDKDVNAADEFWNGASILVQPNFYGAQLVVDEYVDSTRLTGRYAYEVIKKLRDREVPYYKDRKLNHFILGYSVGPRIL